jgi:hypothetical protein
MVIFLRGHWRARERAIVDFHEQQQTTLTFFQQRFLDQEFRLMPHRQHRRCSFSWTLASMAESGHLRRHFPLKQYRSMSPFSSSFSTWKCCWWQLRRRQRCYQTAFSSSSFS